MNLPGARSVGICSGDLGKSRSRATGVARRCNCGWRSAAPLPQSFRMPAWCGSVPRSGRQACNRHPQLRPVRTPCTSFSAAGGGVLRWHPAAPPKAAWKRRVLQSPEAPARTVLRPYRLPNRDPARCRTVLESPGACQLHAFTHRPSAIARGARLPGARAAGPGAPGDLAALGCDPKHNPEARGRGPSYPCSRPRHASLRTT